MAASLIADFLFSKIMQENRDFKGVWIPKEIWLNSDLSPAEKCLLAEIDSLDNDEDKGCFASNEYLGNFIGISEGSCANLICSLKKRGHIIQIYFDGRNRGLRLHKNMKASQKNENSLHKNMKADFTKKLNQTSQKYENSNTSINTDINTIIEGEKTPPTNEIENINFEVVEKVELETLNAEKEKKEKPQLKTMIETYPNEEDFVSAWWLRFGAKYPKVDASKGYNRILHYCETSGKRYADYVRVLMVWYIGESDYKKKSYEFDVKPQMSNLDYLYQLHQNTDGNPF